MSIDIGYFEKINNSYGTTLKKQSELYEIKNVINDDFDCTNDYNIVTINNVSQELLIIHNYQDRYIKKIKSRPDESFKCGDVVAWNESYWLITEVDVDNSIYTEGEMQQCNYVIKFQNKSTGDILSYPVIYKKTAAIINESKNMQLVIKDGKSNILITFCKEVYENLNINDRLIIDNRTGINTPNVFKIINVDTTTKSYNGNNGLIVLTLEDNEFNSETDCIVNWVADYKTVNTSKGNAIILFSGNSEIKCGGSNKIFKAEFKDESGNVLDIEPIWLLSSSVGNLDNFITTIDNITKSIKIQCKDAPEMIGTTLTLTLSEASGIYNANLDINIVAL